MQLLFVLCEYWSQDELNMGWNILSLHLEELTILINSCVGWSCIPMCNTKTHNGISKLTKIKIFFNK